jgi:hypothetical protein
MRITSWEIPLYQFPLWEIPDWLKNYIMKDSFIAVSIIGDSGFAKYGIIGDSIMASSIIGESESAFWPLYTKFLYS